MYLAERAFQIEFFTAARNAMYLSHMKAAELYWSRNPWEKEEYERMMREFYIDLAWDLSSLKDLSKSTNDLTFYWVWYVQKDKDLMNAWWDSLKRDLAILWTWLAPNQKFKKMLGVRKKVEKLKIFIKLKNVKWFKDSSNHFAKHGSSLWYTTVTDYEKAAINFMKDKEWNDFMIWKRTYDRYWVKKDDIFKANIKTGIIWIMNKNWNITTFHKSDQFLKDPDSFLKNNRN